MKQGSVNLEDFLPQWDTLSSVQKARLNNSVENHHFKKGEFLHQGGKDCTGLVLVKDGQLRVFILSEGGKEITLYRLFVWDICLFSASCIMKNISFDLHVEAEKDTDVFIIPADVYDELIKVSLPVSDYTNQLMAARFSDVMWIMEQVLFTRFDSRLADFLLEQSVIEQSDILIITHDEIARHMGSAREVVTKMLNYFASDDMVKLSRGKVTLLDKKKLKDLIQ